MIQRKVGQEASYDPDEWNKSRKPVGKENRDSNSPQLPGKKSSSSKKKFGDVQAQPVEAGEQSPGKIRGIKELVHEKTNQYLQKKPLKHLYEIEGQLWKNNITFEPRVKKDVLDVSKEDFSQYETIDIMGNRATPSNFNIFRDSLRRNKEEIHKRMVESLPEMNLDMSSDGSDSENEIVPLDFRTAMINNKLVI